MWFTSPHGVSPRGGSNIFTSHLVLPWTLCCQTSRDFGYCWRWVLRCEMPYAPLSPIRCQVLFPPSPSVVMLWSMLPYLNWPLNPPARQGRDGTTFRRSENSPQVSQTSYGPSVPWVRFPVPLYGLHRASPPCWGHHSSSKNLGVRL